jgi:hypothetical protein
LCEDPLQIEIAFSCLPALMLPCALVVPRAERRPGGKVFLRREGIHIDADLGDDRFGNAHADPCHRIEQFRLLLKRGKIEGYLITETGNRFIEEVDVSEYGAENQAVMGRETACQSLSQLRKFLPETPFSKIGKEFGVGCALKKGMEN